MRRFVLTLFRIVMPVLLLLSSTLLEAQDKGNIRFYGFVRNDFYYNSRQNEQSIDGVFHISPKPRAWNEAGQDKNGMHEAEMISVSTRLGIDVDGPVMLGAHTCAKVEADFAGAKEAYFMLRLRQAYARFSWRRAELLVGQTWHPLFGSVLPSVISLNTGSPFQPFNRSPQLRFSYRIGNAFSLTGAALYQMQYTSQGPEGASAAYMKRAVIPDLFIGLENKSAYWTSGIGFDAKTIRPGQHTITSFAAAAYSQYTAAAFQFKAKALWGQNMSDHLMLNGYGVSSISIRDGRKEEIEYTNFNIFSSWLNVVYGSKWRVGLFAGFSQNLGTDKHLAETARGYLVYSRGFYKNEESFVHQFADRLCRGALFISYNIHGISFGAEYNITAAQYGDLQKNGRTHNNYWINNYRVAANVIYNF